MAIINGTANNDNLVGTAGVDYLFGFGGNDMLNGGAGSDQMEGGAGDDGYTVDDVNDVVIEGADSGDDWISSALPYYVLPANVESLDFWGMLSAPNVHGVGNALNNRIYGRNGNDILDGGEGADVLHGGLGNDTYYVDHVGDWVDEESGEGYDTIYTSVVPAAFLPNAIERLIYTGTQNVTITAGWQDNDIATGAGNDVINGGGGNDVMRGGRGDDIYIIDSAGDHAVEHANEGIDTVRTTVAEQVLASYVENMVFIGSGNFRGLGNALANRIEGGSGDDDLYGMEGADTLIGLGGNDSYFVDRTDDVVIEAADGGTDWIYCSAAYYVLPAHVEGVSALSGYAISILGNSLANSMNGSNLDDVLNGGGGADSMWGFGGNDTYFIDHSGDYIHEAENAGFDTVNYYLSGSYTLANHLEKLVYLGSDRFNAGGNALDNVLITAGGNDLLNGWAGADTMEGKGGNDTYYVDNAGDKVVEAAGEGTDIVFVTIGTYVLPANVEHLSLDAPWLAFHATGNALDNNIQGGFANDVLDGGAGADTLTGGAGNDTYLLDNAGDRVIEHEGGGTDEIRTSLGARNDFANMFVLPEHIENLTGTSATGQGVYGNAHHNVIKMGAGHDLIVMQDGGNDTVNGGGGDDFVFYGGALNTLDVNDGGAGYDGLGLLGNYDYVFNGSNLINFEKLAVYSSGGGVLMPYSYKLTMSDQNVAAGKNLMVVGQSLMSNETLTFDGSGETNGSYNVRGGKGSDTIVTGAGADQLYGNLGADSLSGGAGNDIFEYYSAAESTRTQWDTILDFNRGDKINLINIDADGNSANGNGKFSYIGSESFSGKAGELRVAQSWDGWLVEADVNGDGAADLMISVQTTYGQMLSASDFWL